MVGELKLWGEEQVPKRGVRGEKKRAGRRAPVKWLSSSLGAAARRGRAETASSSLLFPASCFVLLLPQSGGGPIPAPSLSPSLALATTRLLNTPYQCTLAVMTDELVETSRNLLDTPWLVPHLHLQDQHHNYSTKSTYRPSISTSTSMSIFTSIVVDMGAVNTLLQHSTPLPRSLLKHEA